MKIDIVPTVILNLMREREKRKSMNIFIYTYCMQVFIKMCDNKKSIGVSMK